MLQFVQVPMWLLEGYPAISIKAKLLFSIVSSKIIYSQFEDEIGHYYFLSPEERNKIGALVDCKGSSIGRLFKELRENHLITTYQHGNGVRMYLLCEVNYMDGSNRSLKYERAGRSNTSDPSNYKTKLYNKKDNSNTNIVSIPNFSDILSYYKEKGYTTNPLSFFNYYNSREWIIDGHPVRSWKKLADKWQDTEHTPLPSVFYTIDVNEIMNRLPAEIRELIASEQEMLGGDVRTSTLRTLMKYKNVFDEFHKNSS